MYGAGSVLQGMFYMYREKLFDKNFVRIDKSDRQLILYEVQDSLSITTETDCLMSFPNELCITLMDKKSILVNLSCEDASAWLHDILKYTLAGIATNIAEVRCVAKNKKLNIVIMKQDGSVHSPDVKHEFLIVKLLNGGEEYALDLSGSQYGYFEPVIPLTRYLQSRVENLVAREQFNYFGGTRDRLVSLTEHPMASEIITGVDVESSRVLMYGTKIWENECNMSILSLLKLPLREFREKEGLLVNSVADILGKFHDWLREKAENHKAKVEEAIASGGHGQIKSKQDKY
ncbi:hypothetical protein IFR05_015961 [Cadophora sp. M221]|nr:hypothetical protein IFR05_015961 [Cadophora sp. M221]